jgi:hypothetical protein
MSIPTIDYQAELQHAVRRMNVLLSNVGDPARCRGCGADILWVRHASGRRAPYDLNGETHWATCPKAEQFRGQKT